MSAPVTHFDLHAYVDEQLGPERRAEVEAYLTEHPDAAVLVADYRVQNDRLHALFDPVLNEPVPPRVLAPRRAPRGSLWRIAAAVALVALGALLGLAAMEWRDHRSYEAQVLHPALAAYATFVADKNHAVEVGADQEVAMRNWLSKRMGVDIAIPKFDPQGYALLGGRLLPGADKPNCQLIYQRSDGKRIALFMTREQGSVHHTMTFDARGQERIAHWSNGTLSFVIAGETSPEDLHAIAVAARVQLNRS